MAAPTIVQQAFGSAASATTVSATLSATPTRGNRIVVIIGSTTTSTFSAPSGWNYKKANSLSAGAFIVLTQGVNTSSAATTYSFTVPSSSDSVIHVLEISGAIGVSFANVSAAITSASTSWNAGSLSLNQYPVLNLGYFIPLTAGVTSSTPSGWTANGSESTTGITMLAFTESVSSGSGTMTGTLSASCVGYGIQVGFSATPSAGPWINQVGSNIGTNAAPDATLAEYANTNNLFVAIVSTLGTPTVGTGWTLLQSFSFGGITIASYYKTATSAGGYQYPCTLSASASWTCLIYEMVNCSTSPLGGSQDNAVTVTSAQTITWPSYTPPANCLGVFMAASADSNEPAALTSPSDFKVTDANGTPSGLSTRLMHSVAVSPGTAITPTYTQGWTSGSVSNLSAIFFFQAPSTATTITTTATSAVTGALAASIRVPTSITSLVTEPTRATVRATLASTSALTGHLAARVQAALAASSAASESVRARAALTVAPASAATEHATALASAPLRSTTTATGHLAARALAALRATSAATGALRARASFSTSGTSTVTESAKPAFGLVLNAASALTGRISVTIKPALRATSATSTALRARATVPLAATSTVAAHLAARVAAAFCATSAGTESLAVTARPHVSAASSLAGHATARASAPLRATTAVTAGVRFRFAALLVAQVTALGALGARVRATLAATSVAVEHARIARSLTLTAHTVVTVGFTFVEIVRKLRAIVADLFAAVAALGSLEADTRVAADLYAAPAGGASLVGEAEFLPIYVNGGTDRADEALEQTLVADGTLMDDLEADLTLADTLDASPPILP